MIEISPGSEISPAFSLVLCGERYLAVPFYNMGFQVDWYDIYRPARFGYCSLCRTTLGPDINATYLSPLRRAEDSTLIIRNLPRRAAESHSPRVRFFPSSPFLYPLLPLVSSF